MPNYCWKCPKCEARTCEYAPEPTQLGCPSRTHTGFPMVRDYRTENVGMNGIVEMKQEREAGGKSAIRDLFLPTAKDFEGPDDPDGSKGIRQWNDEHDPRPSNNKPLRPVAPRKSW